MTTWDGEGTVNNAIETIQGQENKIELYETNEVKLADRIIVLKGLRDNLENEVSALSAEGVADDVEIERLNTLIDGYTNEISLLEGQRVEKNGEIETAKLNGDKLAQRISDLEAQLQQANADIATLQTQLENTDTTTNQPLTDVEMADLLETTEEPATQE